MVGEFKRHVVCVVIVFFDLKSEGLASKLFHGTMYPTEVTNSVTCFLTRPRTGVNHVGSPDDEFPRFEVDHD